MSPSKIQVAEFDAFENALFERAENIVDKVFGNNVNSYVLQIAKSKFRTSDFIIDKIGTFNEYVLPIMNEQGLISSNNFSELIKTIFPRAHQFIPLPINDFRLVDIIDIVFENIFGGII